MTFRRLPSFALLVLLFWAATPAAQPVAEGRHSAEIAAYAHMERQPVEWGTVREQLAEATRDDSPTAMTRLDWIHEQGHGVQVSLPLAVIWYTPTVESGAGKLALELGWLHLVGEAPDRVDGSGELLESALNRGLPVATLGVATAVAQTSLRPEIS